MKLAQIITAIQKSNIENAETVAQELTGYVNEIKADQESKVKDLSTQIDNLSTAMGIDQGSSEEKLEAAKAAIAALNKERDDLRTEAANLQGAIAKNSRDALIRSAAELEKVNPTVLETILGTEEIKVDGGKVTIKDQPLKDWVEQHKAPFVPALYASQTTSSLPSSPPHSQPPAGKEEDKKPQSAVASYFAQTYPRPEFINK